MRNERERGKGPSKSGWRIVLRSELSDLWIGGKAIAFLILFSVLLGVMAFLFATNKELSLTPAAEALFLMVKTTLASAFSSGLYLAPTRLVVNGNAPRSRACCSLRCGAAMS